MNGRHVGIDRRGGSFFTVEVDYDAGRPRVTSLGRSEIAPGADLSRSEDGRVVLSVADDLAIVKAIYPGSGKFPSVNERLRFELSQSLLEDESAFGCLFQNTGNDRRFLGAALRQQLLTDLQSQYGFVGDSDTNLSFQLRSFALGRGYLSFCRREAGDLVVLVDLVEGLASVCLLSRDQIVDVTSLKLDPDQLASAAGRDRLAVDLKTVVNFRLAALIDSGISVPISGLAVSGEGVGDDFIDTVQRYFRVNISQPVLNEGYFAEGDHPDRDDWPLYLVALGLTVN
jgi:hypothetical protein